MNESIFDDMKLENDVRDKFGLEVTVDSVIVRSVPVSRSSYVTVFLTDKKYLFAYLTGQQNVTLGEVRKTFLKMGLKPEFYIPPKGRPKYFDEVGKQNFKSVFPGRKSISQQDLIYYRTLAPYNPALAQISEVPDGEIKQFDADAHGQWRTATKFSYRRIKTS